MKRCAKLAIVNGLRETSPRRHGRSSTSIRADSMVLERLLEKGKISFGRAYATGTGFHGVHAALP